jgi:hypothetical protein
MLFDVDEPDGITNLAPSDARRRDIALQLYDACVRIARSHLFDGSSTVEKAEKWCGWEGPVSRGVHSPFAMPGHERHVSVFQLASMMKLIQEARLEAVIVDQGSFGAITPKTTAIYCSKRLLVHLERLIGTADIASPSGADVVGFDSHGKSKAASLAKYPMELLVRLAHGWIAASEPGEKREVQPEPQPVSLIPVNTDKLEVQPEHGVLADVLISPAGGVPQVGSPVTGGRVMRAPLSDAMRSGKVLAEQRSEQQPEGHTPKLDEFLWRLNEVCTLEPSDAPGGGIAVPSTVHVLPEAGG